MSVARRIRLGTQCTRLAPLGVYALSEFSRSIIITKFQTIAAGVAGLGLTLAMAAPASAQYYPQNNGSSVVGAIVNAVTGGYGQYPMGNYGYNQVSQRSLVQQCTIAAEQRISNTYRTQGYGAYNGQRAYGYQNQNGARILGITSVENRNNGLRVKGVATSGYNGQQAYGQRGYNQRYQNSYNAGAQADLAFNCKVNMRGQVTDVNITRNRMAYNRGY